MRPDIQEWVTLTRCLQTPRRWANACWQAAAASRTPTWRRPHTGLQPTPAPAAGRRTPLHRRTQIHIGSSDAAFAVIFNNAVPHFSSTGKLAKLGSHGAAAMPCACILRRERKPLLRYSDATSPSGPAVYALLPAAPANCCTSGCWRRAFLVSMLKLDTGVAFGSDNSTRMSTVGYVQGLRQVRDLRRAQCGAMTLCRGSSAFQRLQATVQVPLPCSNQPPGGGDPLELRSV